MIYGHKDRYITPINGRIPVLIADDDGDAHLHGIVLAPPGMNLQEARQAITDAFVEVRREDPEGWNYDELEVKLRARGFERYAVSVWEERQDGYPPGTFFEIPDEGEEEDDE